MRLYVYADESGTFDQRHNRLFVYGGIILAGAAAKEETTRRFIALERSIRDSSRVHAGAPELKASSMTMRERKRAFMSANWAYMATRDKGTYPRAFAALRAQSSLLQLPPSTAA